MSFNIPLTKKNHAFLAKTLPETGSVTITGVGGVEDTIDITPEYIKILEFLNQKKGIVFVTGGAGTGKSTFIKYIMQLPEYKNKTLLGAPTAISAMNINGRTLHSLCLLPPAWILPSDIKELYKKNEVRKAKLLIIDEISMVNPNLLDAIDEFFQVNRGSKKPFGGLLTIMVGDLFQLPPIINSETRDLFDEYYDSPRFFSSNCIVENIEEGNFAVVELSKVFRQAQNDFIDVLSHVRRGTDVQANLDILNSKVTITEKPVRGAVRLSPRNIEVNKHNMYELNKIESPKKVYSGIITGTFKERNLPSPVELIVKVGAQVMFNMNDPDRKWINGTVGVITAFDEENIFVQLTEDDVIVAVQRVRWYNFAYSWNSVRECVERKSVGTYEQFPLILAWALSIHKSQGSTIQRIHLDLGAGAFETGQTYVALSRCPTMEGISLSREIEAKDIKVDQYVKEFYKTFV